MKNTDIRIERVYDDPGGARGGYRVLVDRLWPRGESKAKFHYDLWAKEVTPSTALREWIMPTGKTVGTISEKSTGPNCRRIRICPS